jgi:1,4-dihydroxy-2-naphthoate octaprenyltransferase
MTTLFITWMVNDILWQGLSVLLILYAVLAGFYFWTKINPKFHPFLLFFEVVEFVILPPALAFFSQSNEPHLFLTLIVISLVPAFLAYQLLIQIKKYGKDMQNDVSSIVVQIGWEKGMVYHNALILLTYVLFALIAILGFPWFLLWPVFLTLPIGLVEIWLMERTRRGGKPLWRVMQLATLSVFFVPIYLIGFAFWIR